MVPYFPSSSSREVAQMCEQRGKARRGMLRRVWDSWAPKLDGGQWLESLTIFLVQLLFLCLYFLNEDMITRKRLLPL